MCGGELDTTTQLYFFSYLLIIGWWAQLYVQTFYILNNLNNITDV